MDLPKQKNIDQYLEGKEMDEEKKEKILAEITPLVYSRNQNAVKSEDPENNVKLKQYLRSVEEYDQIIDQKIEEIILGKSTEPSYDF